MAVTRLSDLSVVPSVFGRGVNLESLRLDALVQSGAVVHQPELDAFLNGDQGSPKYIVRQLAPLGEGLDPNISSDNPAEISTPGKVSDLQTSAVRQSLNVSFAEMDLAVDLYGSDPLLQLQGQLAKYWMGVRQKRLLSTIQGLIADSLANWGGDLLVDRSGVAYATLTDAQLIGSDAIIDAAARMGDRSRDLRGLIVHSTVYATMQKLNMIEQIRLSENDMYIDSFMGFPVIRDDGLTVEVVPPRAAAEGVSAHPAYNLYYSYLFGNGAFATGVGQPKTPYEVDRKPDAGNGGGMETIYHRVEWILHPQGYRCELEECPTVAQLEAAATWKRAWERKRIPLTVIKTRG
jgi:hypothetical protein